MRFTLDEKKLRNRILEEISALRYPPDGGGNDVVDEMLGDFINGLRQKEHIILEELLATKTIGLGLGMGPGGGAYTYILLDQITPQFVQDIIRQTEGRSFYDLEPQCGTEAAHLFLQAWKKAIAEGLRQRLFFRHRHRYYTDEALYSRAKADSESQREHCSLTV